MMKKIIYLVLTGMCIIISSYSQERITPSSLILIKTSENYLLPKLEVETCCIEDTIQMGVSVMVRFKEKFNNSVKITNPSNIYVVGFAPLPNSHENNILIKKEELVFEEFCFTEEELLKIQEEQLHIPSSLEEETPQNKCIRETLDSTFKIWLKEQPYSEMYGIEQFYGYNSFSLSFPVTLIPIIHNQ